MNRPASDEVVAPIATEVADDDSTSPVAVAQKDDLNLDEEDTTVSDKKASESDTLARTRAELADLDDLDV